VFLTDTPGVFLTNPHPQPCRPQDMEETRAYMSQRLALILALEHLAVEAESLEVRSAVADLYMESLRLNANDTNGLRYGFPIALLRVNRDDDAYCFCRYWLTKTDEEDRQRRVSSNEGDWIYPREKDSRYKDIFAECGNAEETIELRSLVSLAIIKMRLVAVHEARAKAIDAMASSDVAIGKEELEKERLRIMGSAEVEQTLSDQRRQLDKVLDLIHRRNEYLIPALLYPDPLMEMNTMNVPRSGTPEEARAMLPYCHSVWKAIPGTDDYLEGRLGTSEPDYLPRRPRMFIHSLH
jgi:hypothetical protein